jgi:hypothetical protein
MGSREDDDYWNATYAEASCYEHGEMTWDEDEAEWFCLDCEDGDELTRTYTYG